MKMNYHQCSRRAVVDGKCRVHSDEGVKKRQEKMDKTYRENYEKSPSAKWLRAERELRTANRLVRKLIEEIEEYMNITPRAQRLINLARRHLK